MAELHETRMGKTLIDSTFPKIAKELKRIADSMEKLILVLDNPEYNSMENHECKPENILKEEENYNGKS